MTTLYYWTMKASPAARWLRLEGDRAGYVLVGPDLKPPTTDDIFVIGDTALVHDAVGSTQARPECDQTDTRTNTAPLPDGRQKAA